MPNVFDVHTDTPTFVVERHDRHRWIVKEGDTVLGILWGSDEEPDRRSFFDMLLSTGRLTIVNEWKPPMPRTGIVWQHRNDILALEQQRYEDGYYLGVGGPDA